MRNHLLTPAALLAALLTSSPADAQAEPARLDVHSAHLEVVICEFRGPHLGSW